MAKPTPTETARSDTEPLREKGGRLGPALLFAAWGALLAAPWVAGHGHGWKFVGAAAAFFLASMFAGGGARAAAAAREYEREFCARHGILPP